MKNIFFLLLFSLLVSIQVSGQKYFTKTGYTEFKASVDAFEPVEAINNSSTAVLNIETGEVAALMFIKAFKFKVALMEEHFNENYMDSDKHPKASFKGKLKDFNFDSLNNQETQYKVNGTLTIRGKEKPMDISISLKKEGNKIIATSLFSVKPGDFDIEIPSIVSDKIAETVNIKLEYELVKK